MRLLKLSISVLLLAALIGPAVVFAGAPDHYKIQGNDVDNNFCGTGQTVLVSFKGVFNEWPDGQPGSIYQAFGHISETWTNPENGVSVVTSFSGGGKVKFVDGDGGGYTIVTKRPGMPEQIRVAGGGVLTQDVGLVIFYDHFDADDNYLGTDVEIRGGPHPAIDPGYDWCDLMIEALGL